MNRTGAIEIPKDPRFKTFANGYVCFKEKTSWDREKQHSTDDWRCVGKVCREKEGFFHSNAIYYSLFPDFQIKEEPDEIDDYLHFGAFVALRESAERCGALSALKAFVPLLRKGLLPKGKLCLKRYDGNAARLCIQADCIQDRKKQLEKKIRTDEIHLQKPGL